MLLFDWMDRFGHLLDECARELKIAATSALGKIRYLQSLRESSIELFPDPATSGNLSNVVGLRLESFIYHHQILNY